MGILYEDPRINSLFGVPSTVTLHGTWDKNISN